MAQYVNPYTHYNLGTMDFQTGEPQPFVPLDSNTLYLQLQLELDLIEKRAQLIFPVHPLKFENHLSMSSNVYSDNIFDILKDIQEKFSYALSILMLQWKHQQRRLENGVTLLNPINIDHIEVLIERAFILATGLLDHLKSNLQGFQYHPRFPQALVTVCEILNLSVVITSQPNAPNHVIREKTRFPRPMHVRFLIGKTGLDQNKKYLEIKTIQDNTLSLMNEAQARQLHDLEKDYGALAIDYLHIPSDGNGTLDKFVEPDEEREVSLRLNFKQIRIMKVKRIKEDEKDNAGLDGNGNTVMDEKLCLLFKFSVKVLEIPFTIWTTTFPFTVSLHKNQNALGAATVIWDDATAEVGREPFKVNDKMLWTEFAEVLSGIFEKVNLRGLTKEHLAVLYSKIFPAKSENLSQESYEYVSWKMLHEKKFTEQVEAAKFSFWDWFYAALKCLDDDNKNNKQLKQMWADNKIQGFISRKETENLLTGKPVGTFLLRFSDSSKGKLSISYVHTDYSILHLNPYALTEFKEQGLALQIVNMKEVQFLYPTLHKKCSTFKDYCQDVVMAINPINPYTPRISGPLTPTPNINESEQSRSPRQAQSPMPQNADSQLWTLNTCSQHSTNFYPGPNLSAFTATHTRTGHGLPSFEGTFRPSYPVSGVHNGPEVMQCLPSESRQPSNSQGPTSYPHIRYIDENMEEDDPFRNMFLKNCDPSY